MGQRLVGPRAFSSQRRESQEIGYCQVPPVIRRETTSAQTVALSPVRRTALGRAKTDGLRSVGCKRCSAIQAIHQSRTSCVRDNFAAHGRIAAPATAAVGSRAAVHVSAHRRLGRRRAGPLLTAVSDILCFFIFIILRSYTSHRYLWHVRYLAFLYFYTAPLCITPITPL